MDLDSMLMLTSGTLFGIGVSCCFASVILYRELVKELTRQELDSRPINTYTRIRKIGVKGNKYIYESII